VSKNDVAGVSKKKGVAGVSKPLLDHQLLAASAFLLLTGRLVLAAAYYWPLLLVGEFFVITGAACCLTFITSLLSQAVAIDEVGGVLGLASAIESACGVLVPPLAGLLFEKYGDAAGALVAAASTAAGLLFVLLVGDISNGTGNTGSGLHKSSALDGKKAR
jgi:hypothetical protein